MAKTTSERQYTYRERMKKKKYVQTTVFIPIKYKELFNTFVKQLKSEFEKEK